MTGKSPIKSAARTLKVFEVFDEHRRPLSVSELADFMDIPQSSASELTKSLTSLGYLSRVENGREYQPTLRISVLGRWFENTLVNGGSVVDMMSEIQTATGETVILAIEQGTHVQYAHVESAVREVRVEPLVGARRLICRATVGIMLLTLKSDDEISRLVRRINAEQELAHPLDCAEVLANVAQARAQGYFMTEGTVVDGIGNFAMLMPRRPGQRPTCLAVGAPLYRFSPSKEFLREVTTEIVARYQ